MYVSALRVWDFRSSGPSSAATVAVSRSVAICRAISVYGQGDGAPLEEADWVDLPLSGGNSP